MRSLLASRHQHLDEAYRDWHRTRAADLGTTPEEWSAAERRMSFDRCASVESHLAWLRDAGFTDADCLFKQHGFAVMVARRAGCFTTQS
ncbi:MAG: hypothetical protein WKF42_05895 [Solirubrobacteraceae bacterium]